MSFSNKAFPLLILSCFIVSCGSGGGGDNTDIPSNADTQAPNAISNLSDSSTYQSVTLTWNAATDNVGVDYYQIMRDGSTIGTTATISFTDSSVSENTDYTYQVIAYDAAGNASSPVSIDVSVPANSGGNDTSDPQTLEVNVSPVTSGNWYRPGVDTTWAWQLQGTLNTGYSVDLYDIDLFDTSAATIAALQANGHRVLCYFSAGSYENWRDDAADFQAADLGSTLSGYNDERWVDIRSTSLFAIMLARLDLALSKGCDGVEPDNMTGYQENSGFSLSSSDQLAFNRNLFNAAHNRGLTVALKNDLEQISELIDYVDLMVNEQCHEYSECYLVLPFVTAGKPVLNAEYLASYQNNPNTVCADAQQANIRTLVLSVDLDDSYYFNCDTDYP